MSNPVAEQVEFMEQAMEPEAAPEPEPEAEAAPEPEPEPEPEDASAEEEKPGKLSGHKRQKAKIQKLESQLAETRQFIQQFHAEALKVLEDNEGLAAQLEDARREIEALRKYAEEYGIDPSGALDPREAEIARLRREVQKREAREQMERQRAEAAQRSVIKREIESVAEKHGVSWRQLAEGIVALGGRKSPEEVAAILASATKARAKATERVGRPGPTTTLRADSRAPARGATYEEQVAYMASLME